LGMSRSGGARNPHVFQHTLRFLRSGGTRPPFARDGFFTSSEACSTRAVREYLAALEENNPTGAPPKVIQRGVEKRSPYAPRRTICLAQQELKS
ncbi:MAG: hypothetical protein ACREYE_04875, partial [Gammaproteobacteria bacterium]